MITLAIILLVLKLFGQKKSNYTENDAKQFYRTIQGDYTGSLNDSTTLSLHFTPIWEREDDRFHWLYMEATENETKKVVEQKILEIVPLSDISFRVILYDIKHPESFIGKWSNRNYFDGFNTSILKGKGKFLFMKTMDFEYQTNWNGRKTLKCFAKGAQVHFKFVQEDERLYVKWIPKRSSRIFGITFFKAMTD